MGRSRELLTPGTSDSCRPRGVVTRDFSAIFDCLFDRLPVRISTSDLHHWILRKKVFHIRAYDFGVQFSFKLSGCGFSSHSMKGMKSFLANCTQRVKVRKLHSEWATLSCGILQGTVLDPTPFLVFINDLSTNLVGKPCVFADDSTVFFRQNNKLETYQVLSKDLILPRIGL